MRKRKTGESNISVQGFCCPHCADSKYPCVNMERLMKTEKGEKKPEPRKKIKS